MTADADSLWRVLLVEDEEPLAITTSQSLERRPVSTSGEYARVERVVDFDEALRQIEDRRYDLIILDIRDQAASAEAQAEGPADSGDEATSADKGLQLYTEIRSRRFIPIVFYSAVAHLADHLNDPPFVTVVSKLGNEDNLLRRSVVAVFDSLLPLLNRSLAFHVDIMLRDFMIKFVEKNWTQLVSPERRADLAYLMARRLARSLDATYVADLADSRVDSADGKVHPTRLYIMPPLTEAYTGDIVHDDSGHWFIVLTPSCDLVKRSDKRKAEFVMVAACLLLTDLEEYGKWLDAGLPDTGGKFNQLIANNRDGQRDRYYFLPAAWGLPDLVVDLQRISHVSSEEFDRFTRVATLDDPYAQAIVSQLGRYGGRVGTPDLDLQIVRQRLRSGSVPAEAGDPESTSHGPIGAPEMSAAAIWSQEPSAVDPSVDVGGT